MLSLRSGQDVHSKYRTASSATDDEPVARFNERFLLSLGSSPSCLLLDDELNVLPLSKGKDIQPLDDSISALVHGKGKGKAKSAAEQELAQLREEVKETQIVAQLIRESKTRDQALSILTLLDILSSSASSSGDEGMMDLSTIVSLTAGRGRGKSAALGLAIAAAVAYGYSNIFVTSPSPDNLKTLFQFLLKGLDALEYKEVQDWELIRGKPGTELKDTILRVNIFRNASSSSSSNMAQGRQIVQYISPEDAHILSSNAELVVIDEAAAIPLPHVRELMSQGQYLVFLSSTNNGYEGTGQSLSLKLLQQLRNASSSDAQQQAAVQAASAAQDGLEGGVAGLGMDQETGTSVKKSKTALASSSSGAAAAPAGGLAKSGISGRTRSLREIQLQEPIRYSAGDHIEKWLHELLCLDASLVPLASTSKSSKGKAKSAPHPSHCELYLVNRDALFSYHPASEAFLQKFMALYAASHYKNSPNDLQLMSDAPGQRLFVLLKPPSTSSKDSLPEPLVIVQVALEGNISRQAILNSLSKGTREAGGDLIPWLLSNYFQDPDFASELSGARVVRIAVHPDYARMGYGTRALKLLKLFYKGQLLDADAFAAKEQREQQVEDRLDTFDRAVKKGKRAEKEQDSARLLKEDISLRDAKRMPALLQRLPEQRPEQIDWIGATYGLTQVLFQFFSKLTYTPLYVRQAADEVSGEYTIVQLEALTDKDEGEDAGASWLSAFAADFMKRFISLLGYRFRDFSIMLALNVLETAADGSAATASNPLTPQSLEAQLTPFDLKRLEAFGNSMVEMHIVVDLFPTLAAFYFQRRLFAADEDADVEGRTERAPLKLSTVQAAILLALGLQRKELGDVEVELNLPASQLMALFTKAVRRMVKSLRSVQRKTIEQTLLDALATNGQMQSDESAEGEANENSDDEEMMQVVENEVDAPEVGGDEETQERKQRQKELLASVGLDKYHINDDGERDWSAAEKQAQAIMKKGRKSADGAASLSTIVSVKGPAGAAENSSGSSPQVNSSATKKRKSDKPSSSRKQVKKQRA